MGRERKTLLHVCVFTCKDKIVCVLSAQMLSHVRVFATPWTVVRQAPLSMGFSRQGYWSGLPFPSTGDVPNPGTEPECPASLALAGGSFTTEPLGSPCVLIGDYTLWEAEH